MGDPEVEQFLNGSLLHADAVLLDLASKFFQNANGTENVPNLEAKYRTLIEQLPAVVFMVYLDNGSGEAYVSPHIESMLGFSQEEWLEDPIRWYQRIHPDDKQRWSSEAAGMMMSGTPLRSVYRVVARDGRVISFQCDAKMVRQADGRPWFIHGVAFDVSDLKRAEEQLQTERNFASAVLDTVGTLVVVMDAGGRVVRFNRACEQTSGYTFSEVRGKPIWHLFVVPEELARFRQIFDELRVGRRQEDFEGAWVTRGASRQDVPRRIAWSSTVLLDSIGRVEYVIVTGIDVTESKRLERAILDISGREQRRIGQDLHDGLGQHLTGVAFMSKVLEQRLADKCLPEAADAAKIVKLVNQAIHKTRELSRGLLPVLSAPGGLMEALEQMASEIDDLFQIVCRFECKHPVLIRDEVVATHLYHIAQEAVNNAIKHGRAHQIIIGLHSRSDRIALTVQDDGVGIPEAPAQTGMGLHIMGYRSKMIGGSLDIQGCPPDGTLISCSFPADAWGHGEDR